VALPTLPSPRCPPCKQGNIRKPPSNLFFCSLVAFHPLDSPFPPLRSFSSACVFVWLLRSTHPPHSPHRSCSTLPGFVQLLSYTVYSVEGCVTEVDLIWVYISCICGLSRPKGGGGSYVRRGSGHEQQSAFTIDRQPESRSRKRQQFFTEKADLDSVQGRIKTAARMKKREQITRWFIGCRKGPQISIRKPAQGVDPVKRARRQPAPPPFTPRCSAAASP
jgi:hypothetical protein